MADDLGKRALALLVKHEACGVQNYGSEQACPECNGWCDYDEETFHHEEGCEWMALIEASGIPRKPWAIP